MKLFDDMEVDFSAIVQRLVDAMVQSGLISDTHTGSVARLLAETFAREMAVFYAMLEKAHAAGFLETAKGTALDNVVAVLGVKRAKRDLLRGRVTFSRTTPAPEDIGIPVGTRVTGPALNGNALPIMETVEPARIKSGRLSVSVAVQEVKEEQAVRADFSSHTYDSLSPNNLSILPRPLMGVEKVSNPDPISGSGKPEKDDHLRARAAAILREGQTCTIEAIEAALRKLGIETFKVTEAPRNMSGSVEIHLQDPQLQHNPKRQEEVRQAIREVKAAGIHLDLKFIRPVYCQPVITITPVDDDMAEDDFEQMAIGLEQNITAFINNTAPGVGVSKDKLRAIVWSNPSVRQVIEIEMKAFRLRHDPKGDPIREWKADGWQIDALENATVDPGRWPVAIVRKWPARARMNLRVTVPQGIRDQVCSRVRQAAEAYVKSIITTMKIDFNHLSMRLSGSIEGLVLEPTWVVHQSDGRVEELNSDHGVSLENGEQVIVDRIDVTIKGKGFDG